jgi:hypothetical protein
MAFSGSFVPGRSHDVGDSVVEADNDGVAGLHLRQVLHLIADLQRLGVALWSDQGDRTALHVDGFDRRAYGNRIRIANPEHSRSLCPRRWRVRRKHSGRKEQQTCGGNADQRDHPLW